MATASLILILGASIGAHAGHERGVVGCRDCGEAEAAVQEKVVKLRSASLWVVRRKAARGLRAYDWERHPEAVEALADAVLHDRQCLVRQEAAESLGRMKACLPIAHEALARAAEDDPSLIARCAAKKALKAVGKACEAPCDACGPGSSGEILEEVVPPFGAAADEVVVPPLPETSLDPLGPTSFQAPSLPSAASPSPFSGAVDEGGSQPPRRRVQPPIVRPEDAVPLAPPTVPVDRYDRFPVAPPTPADVPAPPVGWPSPPSR